MEVPQDIKDFINEPLAQDAEVASKDEALQWLHETERAEKFGTTGQQIITGLEGAAAAATFGLSTGLETALGVPAEDIAMRREENPLSYMAGQVAGVAGTAAVPFGAGRALGAAGEAAAGLIAGETALAKVGSQAAKMAAENMLFQAGDEVSKMFTDSASPEDAAQTALVNIGLSGVIGAGMGGGFGAISPLWNATAGPRVQKILTGLKDKIDGLPGKMPDELASAIQESGLDVSPEVQAFLSGSPSAVQVGQTLEQAATKSGLKFQQSLSKLNEDVADKLVEAFDKTPEFIGRLKNLSEFETGANVIDRLQTSIKGKAEPIIEEYSRIRKQFSKVPLSSENDVLADRLANLAEDQFGSYKSGSSYKFVQEVMGDLPNVRDLEGLRLMQSELWNKAKKGDVEWSTVGKVVGILREVEGETLLKAAGQSGPDEVMRVQLARSAYGDLANELTDLNQFLKLKKFKGPESFLENLAEAGEENILRKLTREDNVRMVQFLNNKFPEAAKDIRDYQINDLLREASKTAKDNQVINTTKLLKEIDNMTPEMRENLIGPEAMRKIDAIRAVKESLPSRPMNTSGTAKTLDALWSNVPGTAIGALSFLSGSNPIMAAVIGGLSNAMGRDIPDATRLAMLKYIGSGGKIEAGAFKSMVDYISSTMKGETQLIKASQNIFKAGADVLPSKLIPSEKDREKLDKKVEKLRESPDPLMNVGGNSGMYIPGQTAGISSTAMNAINVLNSLRPSNPKMSPLDPDFPPTPEQKQKYNRALDIAEQPLILLKDVKSGTITGEDISLLNKLYPGLYSRLQQKVMNDLNDAVADGETIPYTTRMGLSIFLQQPLDSTMTPQSISSIQSQNVIAPPQSPMQNAPKSMSKLGKMPTQFQTVDQARVARKLKD